MNGKWKLKYKYTQSSQVLLEKTMQIKFCHKNDQKYIFLVHNNEQTSYVCRHFPKIDQYYLQIFECDMNQWTLVCNHILKRIIIIDFRNDFGNLSSELAQKSAFCRFYLLTVTSDIFDHSHS